MQPKSATLGIVARELALDVADALYAPSVVAHLPGVVNRTADSLSRRYEPSATNWEVPAYLRDTPELVPQRRIRTWWRSLELLDLTD